MVALAVYGVILLYPLTSTGGIQGSFGYYMYEAVRTMIEFQSFPTDAVTAVDLAFKGALTLLVLIAGIITLIHFIISLICFIVGKLHPHFAKGKRGDPNNQIAPIVITAVLAFTALYGAPIIENFVRNGTWVFPDLTLLDLPLQIWLFAAPAGFVVYLILTIVKNVMYRKVRRY